MANILDYLDWRSDIPFSFDPFNVIDALILAQLSYLPLSDIVPGEKSGEISVADAAGRYMPELVPKDLRVMTHDDDALLIKKLAGSVRFGEMKLCCFSDITDDSIDLQFAALTCILPDGTRFVSFRGTDSTIAGWKEDFNFSYMSKTPSQICAKEYLDMNFSGTEDRLLAGGHSKGGNLAVYACAFCEPEISERVISVYDFDGPGFREEISGSENFKRIIGRTVSVIPESSLVGQLLTGNSAHRIVKSTATGIMQHLVYSWQVKRGDFVYTEELSRLGSFINRAVVSWVDGLDDDSRRVFVEGLFELVSATDAKTLADLGKNRLRSYSALVKAVSKLDEEHQKVMKDALKKLAVNSKDAVLSGLISDRAST